MVDIYREVAGVSEVLHPYSDWDSRDLAGQLHKLVKDNREELEARNLFDVINNYGHDDITEIVNRVQVEQQSLGHFAVVNAIGEIIGGAEIRSDLVLKRAKLPVLSHSYLVTSYPFANSNVKAWVDKETGPQFLVDAYKDLLFRSESWWRRYDSQKSWTIEPTTSPTYIHMALAASGLIKIATGQFDDGAITKKRPGRSVLYAMIYNDYLSKRGKLTELKKNTKDWSST